MNTVILTRDLTDAEDSAARHAHFIFARSTQSLETWCRRKTEALLAQHSQPADALLPEAPSAWEELASLVAIDEGAPQEVSRPAA